MSKFTIETLENMFLYLGCANIETKVAMDGAIPVESLAGGVQETAAEFQLASLRTMEIDWSTKLIWFSQETLKLATVENVHWTRIQKEVSRYLKDFQRMGICGGRSITADVDGYVNLYVSEIDCFGNFRKFPVKKRRSGNVFVTREYNPRWTFAFEKEHMRCIGTTSNGDLAKSQRVNFLAPFMCGVAQSARTYWQVKTKFEEICPSITLLTDPTGVKEFWKLRDVPEGKKRRSALLHWVEQHWRKNRVDPDVENFVRKHMRGMASVKQGKLTATITPSETDRLDLKIAKEDRQRMKEKKTDRRKRRQRLEKAKSH